MANNEQSPEPTETPREKLEKLSRQFENDPGKIPEEKLAEIGYERLPIEGGWRIRLIPDPTQEAQLEKARIKENRKLEYQWEQKVKGTPFGMIEVAVPEIDTAYRYLGVQATQELKTMLDSFSSFLYPGDTDTEEILELGLPETANIQILYKSFAAFASRLNQTTGIEINELIDHMFKWWSFEALEQQDDSEILPFSFGEVERFLSDYTGEFGDDDKHKVIPSANARRLAADFERFGGRLTDLAEYERRFRQAGQNPIEKSLLELGEDYPALTTYLRNHGLKTQHQAVAHFFGLYLKELGLDDLARSLTESSNAQEALASVSKTNFIQSLFEEETQIKKSISNSPSDKIREYSGILKQIGDEKKRKKQIQNGLIAYFDLPHTIAEIFRGKIKAIIDFITSKNAQALSNKSALTLDATPNGLLDKNPGAVSGDCTEGRPLPFAQADIPVYNVKVFAPDHSHIGNMYLLVAKTFSGKVVWHFDAIQIPVRAFDWSTTIPLLIDRIGLEAQGKGVDMITANQDSSAISNYDYIQAAVRDFWIKQGKKLISIDKPRVPKKRSYSDFQGLSEVMILWKRS